MNFLCAIGFQAGSAVVLTSDHCFRVCQQILVLVQQNHSLPLVLLQNICMLAGAQHSVRDARVQMLLHQCFLRIMMLLRFKFKMSRLDAAIGLRKQCI